MINSFSKLRDKKFLFNTETDIEFQDNKVFRVTYSGFDYWELRVIETSCNKELLYDEAKDVGELNCKTSQMLREYDERSGDTARAIMLIARDVRAMSNISDNDIDSYLKSIDFPRMWRVSRSNCTLDSLKFEFRDLPKCSIKQLLHCISELATKTILNSIQGINYDDESLIHNDRWDYLLNVIMWFQLPNNSNWQDIHSMIIDTSTRFNNKEIIVNKIKTLYGIN